MLKSKRPLSAVLTKANAKQFSVQMIMFTSVGLALGAMRFVMLG